MSKTVKTIDLKGKAYAQVADRIKEFRQDCPNGLIETNYKLEDGQIIFSTRIMKDKAKPESAEATGHAMGKNEGAKAFEKLETISVGRALALLGYMAGGEVASSEEMEDFYAYQEEKIDDAIAVLNDSKSLEELKDRFMSLGSLIAEKRVQDAKDVRKMALS
jgi:hypothetical protein